MEENNEVCLIKESRRQRVKGDAPGRDNFLTFAKIGEVDLALVEKLNEIADRRDGNDLGTDNYNLSQICQVEDVFNAAGQYRQILIQEREVDEVTVDEHNYTKYNEDVSIPFFDQVYRLRISEMPAGHEMHWHIDSNTSVMCRAQICLKENDSVFQFRRRGEVQEFQMKPGEMWFINTAWPHRVVAKDTSRRAAIFGFDYKDYLGKTQLLINK
jgi:hypothetical protein